MIKTPETSKISTKKYASDCMMQNSASTSKAVHSNLTHYCRTRMQVTRKSKVEEPTETELKDNIHITSPV